MLKLTYILHKSNSQIINISTINVYEYKSYQGTCWFLWAEQKADAGYPSEKSGRNQTAVSTLVRRQG